MPKAWSDREKETIRNVLLREGRKLFERYGLQKTTVDDIVKAARISKGAFYHFFESKEALYFSVLEDIESEYTETVYGVLSRNDLPRREVFRLFLRNIVDSMKTLPLYGRLFSSDYETLVRNLPEKTMKSHVSKDFSRVAGYFRTWVENGWMRPVSMEALNGMLVSLAFWFIHRDDLGLSDNSVVEDLWIEMMTEYLIPRGDGDKPEPEVPAVPPEDL